MSRSILKRFARLRDWMLEHTELGAVAGRLTDLPSAGWSAWARTTAGIVVLLFAVQLATGLLMAFHYVPSIESAYVTVAYVEKSGSARELDPFVAFPLFGLATVALLLHLAQFILRGAYVRLAPVWMVNLLLGLVLAAAATGYALPWDARSYNGVNVAASLAGNTPLLGSAAKTWLQNGPEISTLTLSRFYGLHVFVLPALLLVVGATRLFVLRVRAVEPVDAGREGWIRQQLARNSIVVGLVFLAAATYAIKHHAPLAPTPAEASNYLPRPGPQFLWLFEMQKYLHGVTASFAAVAFPAFVIGGLFVIPVLVKLNLARGVSRNHRTMVTALFLFALMTVGALTGLAIYQDTKDPGREASLLNKLWMNSAFVQPLSSPDRFTPGSQAPSASSPMTTVVVNAAPNLPASALPPPPSYQVQCAKCHGANGEGVDAYPSLSRLTTRTEDPRTSADILAIINNPSSFALSSKMRSYKDNLTEAEKQEIVQWIVTLK